MFVYQPILAVVAVRPWLPCVCGGGGSLVALYQDLAQSLLFFIRFSESYYPILITQVSCSFIPRMSSSIISMCWSWLGLNGHLLFHKILEEKKICDLAPRCHLCMEDSPLSSVFCICLFNMNRTHIPPSQCHLPSWQDASLLCLLLGQAWSWYHLLGM